MAEAAVEEPITHARFYCHVCHVEFQNRPNSFTCPHCADGFVEELGDNSTPLQFDESWERISDTSEPEYLHSALLGRRASENGGPMEGRYSGLPRTLTRLASSNLRQQHPIEHLVHDFIINLGVGVNLGGPGNVQLFLGNPGDYAWGREGLDAIVTQLLNQMDSTGPPPVSKAVIDALQVVDVTGEQVAQHLQCSVCWEHFTVKEQVRQLPCLHIYHEGCIRPWLELHGTCPICRQNLTDGEDSNPISSDQTGVEAATGQATNVQNVLRSLFGATPSGSQSNQMDQSESSSNSPTSYDGGNVF
ncbi:E3 ubiquitin-protein ligase Iruka isoform X1 [Dendroctonus ponderosae]